MKIIETAWKWTSGLSKRTKTNYIVLHHAAASKCSAADVDSWHKGNGWSGIGYHFFVRKDGSIYRGRPIDTVGAQVSGHNSDTLGICAEGNYMTDTMPEVQKKAICQLISYLKSNYYPKAQIVGHKYWKGSVCPGDKYPLAEIQQNYNKYDIEEYTEIDHILWELKNRDIISDVELWRRYMENDNNVYWLCRKMCDKVRRG